MARKTIYGVNNATPPDIDEIKAHYIMFLGGHKDGEKWMAPSVPYRRVDLRFAVLNRNLVAEVGKRGAMPLKDFPEPALLEERYVNTGRVREGCVVYEIQE